jgi:uncharacterized protein (DUF1501 family)
MKRRNFVKLTSSASAIAMLPTEVFALFKSAGLTACPDNNSKKIVLVQLAGANDGLNTIVPINQYDKYASLRPTIKLSNSGVNGIINLDTTLSIQNQVGLHPSLTGFKSLYDNGFMRIIQGVGYPVQDKSHFKSTDLWLSGGDGTPANNYLGSGWMGRFLENYYTKYIGANFPLGIQLGSSENSLGFHGMVETGMSINISGQDPSGFYSIVNGLGGAPPTTFPNSEYGNLLRFIIENDAATNTSAQTISNAFNGGSNSVLYPNSNLSNQLKTVARFISGGLQTKVYLVKLGGFDTHNSQVADTTTAHLGTHANLLKQIADAVNSFMTDLNNQNLAEDVVAVTFSEFGRKAGENGNLGTDHGEVAPMFVFGKSIQPGISGTNINLSEAIPANNYQVQTVQHDYRRVFSTLLQDWFGAGNQTLDLAFYDYTNKTSFSDIKVPDLVKTASIVPPSCYDGVILGTEDFENNNNEIDIYPNPASRIVTISSKNSNMINKVSFYSTEGASVGNFDNTYKEILFVINVQNFYDGIYLLKIDTDRDSYSKKLIIKR